MATSSVVTWYGGELSVQDVLGEAGREMSGHVVVWVGARFSACYSDSGLAAGPDRFEGRSRYISLSPSGCPSG